MLYANESCDEHAFFLSAMIEMTRHANHVFFLALGFSCIYTRVQSATADVFPVVYLTRVPGKRD